MIGSTTLNRGGSSEPQKRPEFGSGPACKLLILRLAKKYEAHQCYTIWCN